MGRVFSPFSTGGWDARHEILLKLQAGIFSMKNPSVSQKEKADGMSLPAPAAPLNN